MEIFFFSSPASLLIEYRNGTLDRGLDTKTWMCLLSEDDRGVRSNRIPLYKFLAFIKINVIEIVLSCFLI